MKVRITHTRNPGTTGPSPVVTTHTVSGLIVKEAYPFTMTEYTPSPRVVIINDESGIESITDELHERLAAVRRLLEIARGYDSIRFASAHDGEAYEKASLLATLITNYCGLYADADAYALMTQVIRYELTVDEGIQQLAGLAATS
jgi:hypothetical protein